MSLPAGTGLPVADTATAEHSRTVQAAIAQAINDAGGSLSFAEYMQFVLYEPGLGYYSAGSRKLGPGGDFTTAPESSPLFAQVLTTQCEQALRALEGGSIVEFGAGSGALASELLAALEQPDLLEHYYIVEVSADLHERQRKRIGQLDSALADKVVWVSDPEALSVRGVVIANEVLDAVPTERFRIDEDGEILQQRVALSRAGDLSPVWAAAPVELSQSVRALTEHHGIALADGYTSEVNHLAPAVAETMAATLERGVLLISDYGYGRREFYSPERTDGTLICFFRHHAHADPFILPGVQDITAWVDFSRLAETLDALGLAYCGFTTQAAFLLAGGLPERFAQLDGQRQAALSNGVKTLTLPGEMGERFKFLGFSRDMPASLSGFSGRDYGRLL